MANESNNLGKTQAAPEESTAHAVSAPSIDVWARPNFGLQPTNGSDAGNCSKKIRKVERESKGFGAGSGEEGDRSKTED